MKALIAIFLLACVSQLRALAGEPIVGFTGPFDHGPDLPSFVGAPEGTALGNWTVVGGGGFTMPDRIGFGTSSFGPVPSISALSVTIPVAGTLEVGYHLEVTPSITGYGRAEMLVLVDGQLVNGGGGSIVLPFRANQRLTIQAVSYDAPISGHPNSYGGGPMILVLLTNLVFTPADRAVPPIPATATAQVINGFMVGVTVSEGGRGYASRPGVRFVGGGGSGARGIVELAADRVVTVRVTSPGSGYVGAPLVLIDPPGGRQGGTLAAWGNNFFGQVSGPNGTPDVARIWAGGTLTLARLDSGGFRGWGTPAGSPVLALGDQPVFSQAVGDTYIAFQQSGGQFTLAGVPPVAVLDTPTAGWLEPMLAMAAGSDHVLGVDGSGTVRAWGDNTHGQCSSPAGLSNVVSVAAGLNHSVALTATGNVVAWGDDSQGQASVPADLPPVKAIAAGGDQTVALTRSGRVVVWGSPFASVVPADLGEVKAIAAGYSHILALQVDGRVVAWGANSEGQIDVPADLGTVTAIAAGGQHSLALHIPRESLDIESTVRLRFRWMPGQLYQFESSQDLARWTPVGPPEVADGEESSRVVSTSPGSAFFRLRRLP